MPKCDGRPNETCNRNDNTVRFTPGDLFFCHDCEEFRFPSKPSGQSKCSVIIDSKSGSTRSSKTAGQASNNKQKGKVKNTRKNSQKAVTDSDADSDNESSSIHCVFTASV